MRRHLDDALALARSIHETIDLPGLGRGRRRFMSASTVWTPHASPYARLWTRRGKSVRALSRSRCLSAVYPGRRRGGLRLALREACAQLPDGFDAHMRASAESPAAGPRTESGPKRDPFETTSGVAS